MLPGGSYHTLSCSAVPIGKEKVKSMCLRECTTMSNSQRNMNCLPEYCLGPLYAVSLKKTINLLCLTLPVPISLNTKR